MDTIAALLLAASLHNGLPPDLLSSICWVESKHNAQALHVDDGGTDSIGLCQIKFSTAQWLGFQGEEDDLFDPQINAQYAALYLRHQIDRYHGDIARAVIAYNRGSAGQLTRTEYSDKVIRQWRASHENRSRNLSSSGGEYRQ